MFNSDFSVIYSIGFNITIVKYKGIKYYLNQYDYCKFLKLLRTDNDLKDYVKHYLKNNDSDILKRLIKELE